MNILSEITKKALVWNRERRRWAGTAEIAIPKVFYGLENIGDRRSILAGGIIKTQDLQADFPNQIDSPNILYLISSAIPSYGPMMAEIARGNGARFVLNQNGVAYPAWHGDGWEKTNAPNRLLVQAADYVIYQSQFCKIAADQFIGPCRGKWDILHNPVDTEYFRPGTSPGLDPLVLLQAGTHNRFYRVETAVRTVSELVKKGIEVRLLLAGRCNWRKRESDAIAELEELARTLGVLHLIERRGGYTQEDAVPMFRSAHILLHTQYNDSCPRLVVEAMACGLPVVFSASGGVPELVGEAGGVGIPAPLDWEKEHPPVPGELAEGVLKIVSNYRSFSENARKRAVECFDVRPWLEKHRAVFNNLLKV